jgi:hypothetical protein
MGALFMLEEFLNGRLSRSLFALGESVGETIGERKSSSESNPEHSSNWILAVPYPQSQKNFLVGNSLCSFFCLFRRLEIPAQHFIHGVDGG